jgi:hypothetical protein
VPPEKADENGLTQLRDAARELKDAVSYLRDHRGVWRMPEQPTLPAEATGWNFFTFEKYINQRFIDLGLNLRERYEAQQTGLAAALAAAEKAVNAALIAAEKAVDKAEGAQQLRNEAQNEFRKSLSDLSGLMWTIKEGTAAVESLRREMVQATTNLSARTNTLESNYSNLQGRMWAVSAVWAIVVLAASIGVKFIGH